MDSLWMGVPVITLAGPTAVGRSGVSILSNVGLTELIAREGLDRDGHVLGRFRTALRRDHDLLKPHAGSRRFVCDGGGSATAEHSGHGQTNAVILDHKLLPSTIQREG